MKNLRNKGITLIALVITIIILLILAGVTIAMLTGENGLLTRASNSNAINAYHAAEEKVRLACTNVTAEIKTESASKSNYNATDSENITKLANLVKTDLNAADSANTITEGFAVSADTANSKINITYKDSKLKKDSVLQNVPKEDGVAEFVIEIQENGASVKTEADASSNSLAGTTWTFNDSLIYDRGFKYNVDYYIGYKVPDLSNDLMGVSIDTWTEAVSGFELFLQSQGCTNIVNNITVTDENDNFIKVSYNSLGMFYSGGSYTYGILGYMYNDEATPNVLNFPTATGTCSWVDAYNESYSYDLKSLIEENLRRTEIWHSDYGWEVPNKMKTITFTGGQDIQNQELINWLNANATKVETPTDLTGTKWRINPTPTMESANYNVDFYVDASVADYAAGEFGLNINSWTQLVSYIPNILENLEAQNISANISILNENGNKFKAYWNNLRLGKDEEYTILEYHNKIENETTYNSSLLKNLPSSTGTVSFTMEEQNQVASLEDLVYGSIRGIEVYNYSKIVGQISDDREAYKYTINITGGEDTDNPNLINWLETNATRLE